MTGGGFESGSDYVAAKVSVDVDASGIQTLREMSQEIDRLRTSTEAAARGSASFKSYLEQITQAAQTATEAHRNLSAMLDRTADAGARGASSGGGGGASQALPLSRAASGAYVDPWAGMGAGMGGSRAPSPTDIQAQIDPTRQLDPYKYVNAQAGRYNIRPGEVPATGPMSQGDIHEVASRVESRDRQNREQEQRVNAPPGQPSGGGGGGGSGGDGGGENIAARASRYSSLAGNIMNEMSPGGSWGGVGRMVQGGLSSAAKRFGGARKSGAVAAGEGSLAEGGGTAAAANSGDAAAAEEAASSGGLGSMLGGFGGAATGVGVGLAGLAAFEKGGSMVQGFKNMGMIRGQGAQAGMGDEAAIRTMALNPFLTTEQSRSIIMAGLTEGYSGKQFDSVTNFMADNLKNMNLSVADSVGLLRKNVNEGGQSITGLASSLSVLKGMAAGGSAMSLPDMQQAFGADTGQLITGGGVSGGAASEAVTAGLGVYGDSQVLKGTFAADEAQLGSGDAMGGAILQGMGGAHLPPGLDPTMAAMYMTDHGGGDALGQATGNVQLRAYKMAFSNPRSKVAGSVDSYNALRRFMRLMSAWLPSDPSGHDPSAARELVNRLSNGQNPFKQGQQARDAVTSQVNDAPSAISDFGEQLGADWSTLTGGIKMFAAGLTGNDEAYQNAHNSINASWSHYNYDVGAEASNPVLDNITSQLGASNVEINQGGKWGDLTGSQDQVKALAGGSAKWRQRGSGGEGYTLAQTPSSGPVGGGQSTVSFNPAQVQITIDNQGKASVSPNPVPLSTNQQQVNTGYGNTTLNNPAPGYPDPIRS